MPDEDPVDDSGWLTIVGVSPDIRHGNPRDREHPDVAYVPVKQVGPSGATLIVRSRLDPGGARRRRSAARCSRSIPIRPSPTRRPSTRCWPRARGRSACSAPLFGILAFIALTLASVGLYAVIAYSVSTRTQEIGVRMALGAGRGTVGWLVLRRGLWQLAIGLALGLGGAWAVGKFVLAGIVAQISGTDPAIFVGVPVLLTLVALAACLVPARRAVAPRSARGACAASDELLARPRNLLGGRAPRVIAIARGPRCASVAHAACAVLLALGCLALRDRALATPRRRARPAPA